MGKKKFTPYLGGWVPDCPDARDRMFLMPKRKLPAPTVSLSSLMPAIEDQSAIGSCTANASTSMAEFLSLKAGHPYKDLSRLFLYYATRVGIEGDSPANDGGATLRGAMKALAKFGVCRESVWPYDISKYSKKPTAKAYSDALNHQALAYFRLPNLQAIKQCLYDGYVLVGGFSVYESMMSDKVAKTGVVPFPTGSDKMVGGHAICFVGYSDKQKLLKFANSWGDWGNKGYGFLPYRFVEDGMADDFWSMRIMEGA